MQYLPEEDANSIRRLDLDELDGEMVSKIAKMHNTIGIKKEQTKGAFGKRGTDRKKARLLEQTSMKDLLMKYKDEITNDSEREI